MSRITTIALCIFQSTISLPLFASPPAIPKNLKIATASTSVAFSPDGGKIAVGGEGAVSIYNAATGVKLAGFNGFPGRITSVEYSPDGKLLAAGGGQPGKSGAVYLWNVAWVKPDQETNVKQMPRKLTGPSDVLYGINWSPNGKTIAAASYDHGVYLWSTGPITGSDAKPIELKDHTDAVYGVSFAPDSRRLASAGADRTVKVWDTVTRKRLFTLSESTGELYSVAFRPDGQQLSAVGADKTLRVWGISPTGGTLSKSAFAHQSAILKVIYSRDSRSIFTSSEDLSLKSWNASTLVEGRPFAKQPDWPYGLAISTSGKFIAVSTQNGAVNVYDSATGKHLSQPEAGHKIAVSTPTPTPTSSKIPGQRFGDNRSRRPAGNGGATLFPSVLSSISPMGVVRGREVQFTLAGARIGDASSVFFDDSAVIVKKINSVNMNTLQVHAAVGPQARIGVHRCFVQASHGATSSVVFAVSAWSEVIANNSNKTTASTQPIDWPCTIIGTLSNPGESNYYSFHCKSGEEVVFDVVGQQLRSRIQPVLSISDARGVAIAVSKPRPGKSDATLGFKAPKEGTYQFTVRDFEGAGGGDVFYRVNVGAFPVVTSVFPLGVQRGTTSSVQIEGYNLKDPVVQITVPKDHSGSRIGLPIPGLADNGINSLSLAVSSESQILRKAGNDSFATSQIVEFPCSIEGILTGTTTGPTNHFFTFNAKKGQAIQIDVAARRLGSSLDSEIEILDHAGKPVEMAVARAVGQTEVVLNDRDSATNALRIFNWDDFHINDYLMVGREIVQIDEMPKGPDSDIFFRTVRGQRLTFFGTTPEYHSMVQPVYKVEMHPAGSKFSPNGFPLTRLYYKNDDGGPQFGKDSLLNFVAPAEGQFTIRIADTRGQSGSDFPYRLILHQANPDYRLIMNTEHVNIPHGGSVVMIVECERMDGFDGPIAIHLYNLPKGITATDTTIEAREMSASILLSSTMESSPGAANPSNPFRVVGTAIVQGNPVVRSIEPDNGVRLVTILPDPDLRVTTNVSEVIIRPGEIASLSVEVDRLGKFGARVPIDVKNLPYGVRVDDVGLNGILVTEKDSVREFRLYCQPFVKPQTRLIYVIGNVEGGTSNAASAVLLRVLQLNKTVLSIPIKQARSTGRR